MKKYRFKAMLWELQIQGPLGLFRSEMDARKRAEVLGLREVEVTEILPDEEGVETYAKWLQERGEKNQGVVSDHEGVKLKNFMNDLPRDSTKGRWSFAVYLGDQIFLAKAYGPLHAYNIPGTITLLKRLIELSDRVEEEAASEEPVGSGWLQEMIDELPGDTADEKARFIVGSLMLLPGESPEEKLGGVIRWVNTTFAAYPASTPPMLRIEMACQLVMGIIMAEKDESLTVGA